MKSATLRVVGGPLDFGDRPFEVVGDRVGLGVAGAYGFYLEFLF